MNQGAVEVTEAVDVGPTPATERTDAEKQSVGGLREHLAVYAAAKSNYPLRFIFIPSCGSHLVLQVDVRHEFVLVNDTFEVRLDLRAWSIERRPLRLSDVRRRILRCRLRRTLDSKESWYAWEGMSQARPCVVRINILIHRTRSALQWHIPDTY